MLIHSFSKCDKCGASPDGMTTVQETSVTCQKCGSTYNMCTKCKKQGCPDCKGTLKSSMDFAAENGILF